MAATLCIVVDSTNDSIKSLINKCVTDSTKGRETVNLLVDYLSNISSEPQVTTLQVTIRNTDPAISTSGTGSIQYLYNFK
jgi:hypothetical protein